MRDHAYHENVDVRRISLDFLIRISDTCPEKFNLNPFFVSKLSDTDVYIRKLLLDYWRKAFTNYYPEDEIMTHHVWSSLLNQLGIELIVSTEGKSHHDIPGFLDSYELTISFSNTTATTPLKEPRLVASINEILSEILTPCECECIELDLD